jgi:hypothetical protein
MRRLRQRALAASLALVLGVGIGGCSDDDDDDADGDGDTTTSAAPTTEPDDSDTTDPTAPESLSDEQAAWVADTDELCTTYGSQLAAGLETMFEGGTVTPDGIGALAPPLVQLLDQVEEPPDESLDGAFEQLTTAGQQFVDEVVPEIQAVLPEEGVAPDQLPTVASPELIDKAGHISGEIDAAAAALGTDACSLSRWVNLAGEAVPE